MSSASTDKHSHHVRPHRTQTHTHTHAASPSAVLCSPQVPENLLGNTHFAVSPEIAYHRAMVLTNNQLHRLPDVDDTMSGTCCVCVLCVSVRVALCVHPCQGHSRL